MFVFVKNASAHPWVGLIKEIFKTERKMAVEWMCDASDIKQPTQHHHKRCLNEMYLTTLRDEIDLDTVEDIADVLFHHDGHDTEQLCWRQRYDPKTGRFTPERTLPPNIEGEKGPEPGAECTENIMDLVVSAPFSGRSPNLPSTLQSSSKTTTVRGSRHGTPVAELHATGKFICPFARYGCGVTSHYMQDWKRHVAVQHLRLGVYRCDIQKCIELVCNFRRSDGFTDHRRRMHGEASVPKAVRRDIEARCWIRKRNPPQRSTCGFCGKLFMGEHCWTSRMTHVGQHFVQNESPLIKEREDADLTQWALSEGIVQRGGDGSLSLV